MRGRLWLLAASVAVAVLVGPGLAGAGGLGNSVSATGPDNESATAWFVQLAGSPTAEGASASVDITGLPGSHAFPSSITMEPSFVSSSLNLGARPASHAT